MKTTTSKTKIYIAGHKGLVGSALVRLYSAMPSVELILADRVTLDLCRQTDVEKFLDQSRPDVVIVAAGRVGGIQANSTYPADFIYQNLMIEANLIHGSWKTGVKKLLNFGTSCMYPKQCPQPMIPQDLMVGKLEPTNEPYALAKLSGMSLCFSYNKQHGVRYQTVIPSNLYGPCDSFDLSRCHVVAAMIKKLHEAKLKKLDLVEFWGSGDVQRDFLFVDDLAVACDILLHHSDVDLINIGAQQPCTMKELVEYVKEVVGFDGKINWDKTRPDGAPVRVLDATEINKLGWKAAVDLKLGLQKTYVWFLNNVANK